MSSSRLLEPLDKKQSKHSTTLGGGATTKELNNSGSDLSSDTGTRDHDPVIQLFPKCKPRLNLKSPTDISASTKDWNANANIHLQNGKTRSSRNSTSNNSRRVGSVVVKPNPGTAVRTAGRSGYDNNNGSSTSASSSSASSRLSLASPLPGKERNISAGAVAYRIGKATSAAAAQSPQRSIRSDKGMEVDTINLDPDSGIGGGGSNNSIATGTSSESGTGSGSGSGSSVGGGGSHPDVNLRDSRIEIAGGREIFSQSRSRVSRRIQGQGVGGKRATTSYPSASTSSTNSGSIWEKNSRGYPRVPSLTTMTTSSAVSVRHQSYGDHRQHGRGYGHGHGHHHGRSHREREYRQYSNPRFDYATQARNFERGLRFPNSEDADNGSDRNSYLGHHHLPQVHGLSHSHSSEPAVPLTIKETVFGSEITSIEKSIVGVENVAPRSSGGEIVFDDIDDETWREEDAFSKVAAASSGGYDEFDDNLSDCSSPRRHDLSGPSSGTIMDNNRHLGLVPIADYEGSPKRYGLKSGPGINLDIEPKSAVKSMTSPPSNSIPTSTSFHSGGNNGSRLPGFPQRVNKPIPQQKSEDSIENGSDSSLVAGPITPESVIGQLNVKLARDMSPDDSVASQHGSQSSGGGPTSSDPELSPPHGGNPTATTSSADAAATAAAAAALRVEDLYEFSETRKVLEDFFKGGSTGSRGSTLGGLTPETRSLLGLGGSTHDNGGFSDLDYTLKRQAGNSYIGSRLAGDMNVVELSPRKPPRRGGREVVMSMSLAVAGEEGPDGISGTEGSSPRLISFHEVSRRPSSLSPGSQSSHQGDLSRDVNDNDIDVETASTNTETDLGDTEVGLQVGHSRNFTLSPETTDCDSNELESEMSLDYDASLHSSSRVGATMPVLEDGLSSGNASESEEGLHEAIGHGGKRSNHRLTSKHSILPSIVTTTNCAIANSPESSVNPTLLLMKKQITEIEKEIKLRASQQQQQQSQQLNGGFGLTSATTPHQHLSPTSHKQQQPCCDNTAAQFATSGSKRSASIPCQEITDPHFDSTDPELEALDPMRPTPPPSPAPAQHHHQPSSQSAQLSPASITTNGNSNAVAAAALQDIKEAILRTKQQQQQQQLQKPRYDTSPTSPSSVLSNSKPSEVSTNLSLASSQRQQHQQNDGGRPTTSSEERLSHQRPGDSSPVWVPRRLSLSGSSHHSQETHNRLEVGVRDPLLRKSRYEETPDDDADTDQETDRLLGQNRADDDYGFYDEKERKRLGRSRGLLPSLSSSRGMVSALMKSVGASNQPSSLSSMHLTNNHHSTIPQSTSNTTASSSHNLPLNDTTNIPDSSESSQQQQHLDDQDEDSFYPSTTKKEKDGVKKKRSKEDYLKTPSVLIEGVLFRARYLGSTQLVCEGQPTKATRMLQAEEAVSRIKAIHPPAAPAPASREDSAVIVDNTPMTSTSTVTVKVPPYVPHPPKDSSDCEDHDYDEYLYAVGPDEGGSDDDENDGQCSEISQDMTVTVMPVPDDHTSNGESSTQSAGRQRGMSPYGSAIPGTMFRLRFYGSLEVEEEVGFGRRRRRRPKKTMVEEAVMKVKAPEGETQPSTEVDLFISTEKIMVLNTDLKEIMMDHALRTISYIADIGDLVVLMARRRPIPTDHDSSEEPNRIPRPPKMICHVFESDEAQYIAQSIGQAFQVAYMEFLKANGIEDQSFVREMDYQEVLNSQEIFGDELQMFAKKELQKEVVVPKTKGEILGVVIVESGWGSMLPTVVIANLAPAGAAARCGQLNIGDQIIAINGVSLVGLPLSTCQTYIKNTKPQTVVKLTIVPCPPVVEVKIKRPDTKYQLGFSVQNGVICSLLRGGIAERGGVRVGHRIIEINNQSVVAVPHEKIVNLLATSVGEINMKTMPTSMFRLLTGQETPLYI